MLLTDDLTIKQTERRPLKKFIPHLTNIVVHFVLNLFACIYLLLPWLKSCFIVQHSSKRLENQTKPQLPCSSSQEQSISQAVEKESFHPCWQRLQRLEELVTELINKPKRIPPEKEDMLLESLSRIKSIEQDLQKTKKVSAYSICVCYAGCFWSKAQKQYFMSLLYLWLSKLCLIFPRHYLQLHQNKWSLLNRWNTWRRVTYL